MSNGAGIHPINAIKNRRPPPLGKICFIEIEFSLFVKAIKRAIRLLTAKTIIITLITLSRVLYFPKIKIKVQKTVIKTLHITIFSVRPNNSEASPAVTIVTAV